MELRLGSTRLLPNRLPRSTLRESDYCVASLSHLQNKLFFSTLVYNRISLSCLLVDCGTYLSTFWLVAWNIGSTCPRVTCKTQGRKNKNPNSVTHTSCHLLFITLLFPAVLITQFIHFRLQNVSFQQSSTEQLPWPSSLLWKRLEFLIKSQHLPSVANFFSFQEWRKLPFYWFV